MSDQKWEAKSIDYHKEIIDRYAFDIHEWTSTRSFEKLYSFYIEFKRYLNANESFKHTTNLGDTVYMIAPGDNLTANWLRINDIVVSRKLMGELHKEYQSYLILKTKFEKGCKV